MSDPKELINLFTKTVNDIQKAKNINEEMKCLLSFLWNPIFIIYGTKDLTENTPEPEEEQVGLSMPDDVTEELKELLEELEDLIPYQSASDLLRMSDRHELVELLNDIFDNELQSAKNHIKEVKDLRRRLKYPLLRYTKSK